MNKWLKRLGPAVVIVALLIYAGTSLGTTYTKSYTLKQVGDNNILEFVHTFAARTDVAVMPFQLDNPLSGDSCIIVSIAVLTAADSLSELSIDWETSWDNSTWVSQSLGTDSTSWAASGVTYSQKAPIFLKFPTYTWGPYARIEVTGTAENSVGTKIRVDILKKK